MRWRLLIAIALLVAVIAGGLATLRKTERVCDTLSDTLRKAYADGAGFEDAYALWQRSVTFFSALISHDRVDELGRSFAQAKAFLSDKTMDEYRAALLSILQQLSMLKEYDRPTIRSLL